MVNMSCCEIRKCKRNPQIVSGIRKLKVETANFKWNPYFVWEINIHIGIYVKAF